MAYNRNEDFWNLKIFKLNRIKFEELWNDAITYVKESYEASDEEFTIASPFAQILSVVLHLGRLILYYIEDSITGLNITTAWRPDQIRGLAALAGHDAGRSISARGSVKISYNGQADSVLQNEIVYIPNKTKILNNATGLEYILLFSADNARLTIKPGNYITGVVAQGTLRYQQLTSSGQALQSFNFTENNYQSIDQYFINVYVNGEPWDIVTSLVDLGYDQKGCIVKTGQHGGIDVFFGNLTYGAIPPLGANILVEYLVNAGAVGNWAKDVMNNMEFWSFLDDGFLKDGTSVDLNNVFSITPESDLIFGTSDEDIALTQKIAPYTSRSFVLGNAINYEYFLKKMNMFSRIQVISGFEKSTTVDYDLAYRNAISEYGKAKNTYDSYVEYYGKDSEVTKERLNELREKEANAVRIERDYKNSKLKNNTVYLLLVPDITKRIGSNGNYFTCNESLFTLRDDEKISILDLIEASGQRILTVENAIIDPIMPRFAINVSVRIWSQYSFEDVYTQGLSVLSTYFLTLKRTDRIPISDIIALFEGLDCVDSVNASFDADVKNKEIYKSHYGIDEFGDVVLTRKVIDYFGNTVEVQDLFPLFRGGFVSQDGVNYSDEQDPNVLSAFNLSVIGSSKTNRILTDNLRVMN